MRTKILTGIVAAALMPMAASATTFTPAAGNQGFLLYDHVDSNQDLGDFNLAESAVALTALFADLDVAGSLSFGVFSDPLGSGAGGSLDINLTRQGDPATVGSDNETFQAFFGGEELTFVQTGNDFVANFSLPFSSVDDILEFELTFTGFDISDQFQVNVARVAPIPLPAALPVFLLALGGLGYLSSRRKMAA